MEAVTAALNDQYEKAKENLKGVDENIIKLYGRDPNEKRQRRVSRSGGNVGGAAGFGVLPAGRLFGEARRIINNPNREPVGGPLGLEHGGRGGPVRRVSLGDGSRLGSIQSRLGPKRRRRDDSGDDDDLLPHKPMMQSAVVIPVIEPPKREDSAAMKTDKKGMARNRRMFGALLGTLQSFQKDSKKEEDREKRRAEVEKKLEEKQKDEEHQLRRDRAALWNQRREKQRELRQLEAKMKLVKSFEEWERIVRDQAYFIKTTKGKHHIYYKPRTMLPANEKALEATEDYIEDLVKERKRKLEEEIERVMSAPVRLPRKSPDPNSQGKEGSDKSDHSDSESELSGSDMGEDVVSARKRARAEIADEDPQASHPVKSEKKEGIEIKQETVDSSKVGDVEGDEEPDKVSNEIGDEVTVESEDELSKSHTEEQKCETSGEVTTGKSDQNSIKDSNVVEKREASERKHKSPLRRRSGSGSGRSLSRSPSRSRNGHPPIRHRKPDKQGKPKSNSGSGSSSSGSNSGSGSDSGSGSGSGSSGSDSDSEPETKAKGK